MACDERQTINIPVDESDVLQTIQSLPRTPTEAGIIPVKLKRKVAYKNAHKYEYVSVSKVVAALHTLMVLGHKYYHFVSDSVLEFKEKCRQSDAEGYDFLFPGGDGLLDMDAVDVQKFVADKVIRKTIVVPGRLVNIVV